MLVLRPHSAPKLATDSLDVATRAITNVINCVPFALFLARNKEAWTMCCIVRSIEDRADHLSGLCLPLYKNVFTVFISEVAPS